MTKGQLEEEGASKNDALRLLSKSVGDSQMWRQKYEKEGLAKAEESESAKMKLQSRLAEAEGCVSNLNGKAMSLEREKCCRHCYMLHLDLIQVDYPKYRLLP